MFLMAKILHSDVAPAGSVHYTFAALPEGFDLSGKTASHETTDSALIAEALIHPWLRVEYPKEQLVAPDEKPPLDPKDDPLSAVNDNSNDPAAVKASEDAKRAAVGADEDTHGTALDAGLDQKEVVVTGDVAETVAADKAATKTEKGKN